MNYDFSGPGRRTRQGLKKIPCQYWSVDLLSKLLLELDTAASIRGESM